MTTLIPELLTLLALGPTAPAAPPAALPVLEALKQHARALAVQDGELAGEGAEFLVDASRGCQFVLLGEQHNVLEIPQFTASLFRLLHEEHGFDHYAMENGWVGARLLGAPGVVGDL